MNFDRINRCVEFLPDTRDIEVSGNIVKVWIQQQQQQQIITIVTNTSIIQENGPSWKLYVFSSHYSFVLFFLFFPFLFPLFFNLLTFSSVLYLIPIPSRGHRVEYLPLILASSLIERIYQAVIAWGTLQDAKLTFSKHFPCNRSIKLDISFMTYILTFNFILSPSLNSFKVILSDWFLI